MKLPVEKSLWVGFEGKGFLLFFFDPSNTAIVSQLNGHLEQVNREPSLAVKLVVPMLRCHSCFYIWSSRSSLSQVGL